MILVLALSILGAITAPMVALLSAGLFEPVIARNQVNAVQALYSAEAGVEWAFNLLVNTSDWDTVAPATASPAPVVSEPAVSTLAPPEGLLPSSLPKITARRGLPPGSRSPGDQDAADVITVTSTAVVNGAHRTVEVVVRRLSKSAQGIFDRHAVVAWRER